MENGIRKVKNFKLKNKENFCKLKKSKENENDCPICLQSLCCKKNKTKLSCNHTFHSKCIDKWFEKDNRCPLCRNKEFDNPDNLINDANNLIDNANNLIININNLINTVNSVYNANNDIVNSSVNLSLYQGYFSHRIIYQDRIFVDIFNVYPINVA